MALTASIEPETDDERRIVADPRWRAGVAWGRRTKGHPEDSVGEHIAQVLANIDAAHPEPAERARLRLIALVHDAFKHDVRWWRPGRTDHARLARAFAQDFTDDRGVLLVTELHDDAYRAWRSGRRTGLWGLAERRALALRDRLGDELPLFLAFYRADNATGDKAPDDLRWFEDLIAG